VLEAELDAFRGVIVDPASLPGDPRQFADSLRSSLRTWRGEGLRTVWLRVPIAKSGLVPVAVEAGFEYHHCRSDFVMLICRLVSGIEVPSYASHCIGAGGVVLNDSRELLVVWERSHRANARKYYKLPGGALHHAEHLVDGVIREVREETGIDTCFRGLVCFRHWHGYRFGTSDIYFVCRLSPLNTEIHPQEAEIAECLWMPVGDYLASEYVGAFNKHIVQAAIDERCLLKPVAIDGYSPEVREVFMPPGPLPGVPGMECP
jgi:8-oxo-dGTP pyrophosphatase MutT (NUDIX family)